jgi:hypothetical protein
MKLKNFAMRTAIVGALGVSALGFGGALGTASADPGFHDQPCFLQFCHDRGHGFGRGDRGFDGRRWDQRGFDDGRRDHLPFNYQGHRVEPFFDHGRGAWGFWSFNSWIPF